MLNAGEIHALRDPTRGGLATSLCEIAMASSVGVEIESTAVLVREDVKGACEILGLDPLFVANEGKLIAFVPDACAEAIVKAMRGHPAGRDAKVIGRTVNDHAGMVLLTTEIGGTPDSRSTVHRTITAHLLVSCFRNSFGFVHTCSLTVAAPFRAFTLMNDELASRNSRNTRLAVGTNTRLDLLLDLHVAA